MHKKLEHAQTLYNAIKVVSKDKGQLSDNLKAILESEKFRKDFELTEFELKGANKEFLEFLKKQELVKKSFEKYGYTEQFEVFNHNLDRLLKHFELTAQMQVVFSDAIESDILDFLEYLDYSADEDGYEKFQDDLKGSKDIIYEQGLISLVAIFEAYITDILKWIYVRDDKAIKKLKVNLEYAVIASNPDKLPSLVINNHLMKLGN